MKKIVLLVLAISSLFIITSCQVQQDPPKAKYVFLFIGDGMGLSQVIATEAFLSATTNEGYVPLNFRQFPAVGLSTTFAENSFITGSAAAGTALASGNKTNISRISTDTSGVIPLETIAHKAKQKGMKVGIISSVSIDHATPAVFYANQKSRNMYHEIDLDLAKSNFDFYGGGGMKEPVRDDIDAIAIAKENGFRYINDKQELRDLKSSDEKVLFVNPELTGGSAMYYAIDQPADYITLSEITNRAIEYLDNENGFFMMVEGGKIDWASHANDLAAVVHEVIDFSAAVEEAVNFYYKHPDETLIVVTADHETGGLALGNSSSSYKSNFGLLANQKISGEAFNKVLEEWWNDHEVNEQGLEALYTLTEEYFGIGKDGAPLTLSDEEMISFGQTFERAGVGVDGEYGSYSPITYLSTEILSRHAGAGWTSSTHTGVAVPVYSIGVNHQAFSINLDNTDIPKLIWETIE